MRYLKKIILYTLLIFIFFCSIVIIKKFSTYQEYRLIKAISINNPTSSEDGSLFGLYLQDFEYSSIYQEESILAKYNVDIRLSAKETNIVIDMLKTLKNTHVIFNPEQKDRFGIRSLGIIEGVGFIYFDSQYFSVNGKIYATSDNYPEVYNKLKEYLCSLDPLTHASDRPV